MALPAMSRDFKELLAVFNRHRVKYLVVGAFAVMRYTEPRYTKDLDLWVEPALPNARRVYAALVEFGGPVKNVGPEDFAERDAVFQMGVAPVRIDIIGNIAGVRFSTAWRDRVRTRIDKGLYAPFLSRADIIKAKRASGRAIDLWDVEGLLGRS